MNQIMFYRNAICLMTFLLRRPISGGTQGFRLFKVSLLRIAGLTKPFLFNELGVEY
jgi:hypothetical protein